MFYIKSGIYAFILNNKIVYIGKSINLTKRKQRHIQELRAGKHCNRHFQRAFIKYGENSFDWKVLEYCDEDELNNREIYWIDKYDVIKEGFNQNHGGDGGARTFGIHVNYTEKEVLDIARLLSNGISDTIAISHKVFGDREKGHLDYIGRIRRREIRLDLISSFNWDSNLNYCQKIPDKTIIEICKMFAEGKSNKEIALKIFGQWSSTQWNYLIKLRNRKTRTKITKNYKW